MSFFKNNSTLSGTIDYTNVSVDTSDLDSTFLLFAKFEQTPIVDELTGGKFVINSPTSNELLFVEEGAYGNGLKMKPQVELSYGLDTPSLTAFSLGFWLKPVNISPTVNPRTGQSNYYRMGLIDRAQFQVTLMGDIETVPSETDFVVYEECIEEDMNVMYVLLQSSLGDHVVYKTSSYQAGAFHHFWITYSGAAESLQIYRDGINQDLVLVEGSGVPFALGANSNIPLHINKSAIGYNGLLRGNFGLIDELVLQESFVTEESTLAKHINLGSEFVINESLFNLEEIYCGFIYDDQTTIDISSIYSNGKNIYAGRTDGRVFRGDRAMWKSRKDFANRDEINFINKRLLASDAIASVEDGSLKLFKASARI